MKQEKVKVLYFPIDEKPQWLEIENNLKAKQKLVEGYIEFVSFEQYDGPSGVELVINEEGKFTHKTNQLLLDRNGSIIDFINGPFFAIGAVDDNGYCTSLSEEAGNEVISYFNRIVEFQEV